MKNLWDKKKKILTDYYQTLQVSKDASQNDIKNSFRKLARKYHPDMNPGDIKTTHKFIEVTEAYNRLRTEEKRDKVDAEIISDYCISFLHPVKVNTYSQKKNELSFFELLKK